MANEVRYEKMAEMFLNDNKNRQEWIACGFDRKRLSTVLKHLEQNNQMFSISNSFGMPKAFIAWVYCDDTVDLEGLKNQEASGFYDSGKNIFPLFMAGKIGLNLARRYGSRLVELARKRGGKLISYRNGRVFSYGKESSCQTQ